MLTLLRLWICAAATGEDLVIETNRAPNVGLKVKRVSIDGKRLTSTTVTHAELSGARLLRVELGS